MIAMLAFKSTLSVTVNPPEFPEFITKFDPSIKLPLSLRYARNL